MLVEQEAKSELKVAGEELTFDCEVEVRHNLSIHLSHRSNNSCVALIKVAVNKLMASHYTIASSLTE